MYKAHRNSERKVRAHIKQAFLDTKAQCIAHMTCLSRRSGNAMRQACRADTLACMQQRWQALSLHRCCTCHSSRHAASGMRYQGPTDHREHTRAWQARAPGPALPVLPPSSRHRLVLRTVVSLGIGRNKRGYWVCFEINRFLCRFCTIVQYLRSVGTLERLDVELGGKR